MRNFSIILILLAIILFGCHDINATNDTKDTSADHDQTDIMNDDERNKNVNSEDDSNESADPLEDKDEPKQLDLLEVHYIDVGQADATLLKFTYDNESYTILFDAGDWRGNEVVPYLNAEGVETIDIAIISHPHADHIGQLKEVLEHFPVDEIWMTGNTAATQVFQNTVEAIMNSEADYVEPTAGDTYQIGPLSIDILHPGEQLTGDLNEDSLSVRFTYGSISFLFTGDAYKSSEQQMLQRQLDVNADFLQLGHHGSNTSSDESFVKAVQPRYAIYSAGAGNSYGHPHEEVVTLFDELDIPLYGTDVHGTIVVTTDGITSKLSTAKEGTVPTHGSKPSSNEQEGEASLDENNQTVDSSTSSNNCIDINSASLKELQKIKHIGPTRAEELIELRPFDSVNNLTKINGIGPARLKEILDEQIACVK